MIADAGLGTTTKVLPSGTDIVSFLSTKKSGHYAGNALVNSPPIRAGGWVYYDIVSYGSSDAKIIATGFYVNEMYLGRLESGVWKGWKEIPTTESGTWTPTLKAMGADPTYQAIHMSGVWHKIGNIVFVSGRVEVKITNTGSGAAYVEGLPFPATNVVSQSEANVHFNYNIARRSETETAAANVKISSVFWNTRINIRNEWGANPLYWLATQYGYLRFSGWYSTN